MVRADLTSVDRRVPTPASPLPLSPAQTCWNPLPIPATAAPARGRQRWGQTPVHAAASGRRWFPLTAALPAMSDHDALAQAQAGIFCVACSDPSIPGRIPIQGMFSSRKSPAAEGRSQFCLGECFSRSDGQNPPFLPTRSLSHSNLETTCTGLLRPKVYRLLRSPPPQRGRSAARWIRGHETLCQTWPGQVRVVWSKF